MTKILEIREQIKNFYAKFEMFILPVVKFIVAFVVLNTLNGKLGYMARLDSKPIALMAALLCSFLPNGFLVFFAAVFSLLHLYTLSLEVAAVTLCLYLVLFVLFFRFSPKESLFVVLTPLCFVLKIPYVIPIIAGLLFTPAAIVSVGSGVVVHFYLQSVLNEATTIKTMGDEEAIAKLRLMIDALVGNKAMVITLAAFTVAIIVVYLVRRMEVDYAWTIAMAAGAIFNIIVLLVGDLKYDTNLSVGGVIFGSILGVLVGKVLEFFRFCVDYSRTEKVQFEDDEYYYYVKAIPKMTVTAPTKTVKKINSTKSGSGRKVETEKVSRSRERNRAAVADEDYLSGGVSMTVGAIDEEEQYDPELQYEEEQMYESDVAYEDEQYVDGEQYEEQYDDETAYAEEAPSEDEEQYEYDDFEEIF